MGGKVKLPIGMKKNAFTVLGESNERNSSGAILWLCECECGNIKKYTSNTILNEMPKSCGCVLDYEDMTGRKFNEFTVINLSDKRNNSGVLLWECRCSCGELRYYLTSQIKRKAVKSCGCKQNKYKDLPKRYKVEHYTWESMKSRCSNPKHPDYVNYGGRNIKVCDRWKDSFTNFLEDMGHKPRKDLSIERIDNNKGYSPDNCTWGTATEQVRNRRVNKNNTTGVTGVIWEGRHNKWHARITKEYKNIHLGYFHHFEDAVKARKEAEIKYFGK